MSEPSTPLMRQYTAIKKEHPNALLFFRLGDFYELFFEDAVVAARELQITLTSRNKEKGIAIPMCGVPYHSAENYIAKLIRRGFKVAICEQIEDPKVAKKLVKREVTRVLTPGTAVDAQLGSEENNFLACVARSGDAVGFAALDLSTGEFRTTEFVGENADRAHPRRVAGAASARSTVRFIAAALRTVAAAGGPGRGSPPHCIVRECELGGDSAGGLGLRPRLRHSAGGESLRRAVAGRLRPGKPLCGSSGRRRHSALRPHYAARIA